MNVPSGTCALGEKGCFTDGKCYYNRNCENKVVTNADRIRAMSDEELAVMLNDAVCPIVQSDEACEFFGNCVNCWLHWLKQPVKDGE